MAMRIVVLALALLATQALASELVASWDPNPPAEQVTGYRFAWEADGAWGTPIDVPASGSLEVSLTDPTPGQYRARVQAVNAAGGSLWAYSDYVAVNPSPDTEPPPSRPILRLILTVETPQ